MKKVSWGILSTAKIGREKVIPAMQRGEFCNVVAIASRNKETAQAEADRLNIFKAYGSYEELLSDAEIDAVYIPLPNHLHVEWAIKSLEAGKHVLCEKPIGLTSYEAQQLQNAAYQKPHLKVMEAFMYRFHPQWLGIRRHRGRETSAGQAGLCRRTGEDGQAAVARVHPAHRVVHQQSPGGRRGGPAHAPRGARRLAHVLDRPAGPASPRP
jgi:hypothetical protein